MPRHPHQRLNYLSLPVVSKIHPPLMSTVKVSWFPLTNYLEGGSNFSNNQDNFSGGNFTPPPRGNFRANGGGGGSDPNPGDDPRDGRGNASGGHGNAPRFPPQNNPSKPLFAPDQKQRMAICNHFATLNNISPH